MLCADIRKKLSILTVSDQIKMQISSLMWDYDNKSLPSELAIKFAKISSVHNYLITINMVSHLFEFFGFLKFQKVSCAFHSISLNVVIGMS